MRTNLEKSALDANQELPGLVVVVRRRQKVIGLLLQEGPEPSAEIPDHELFHILAVGQGGHVVHMADQLPDPRLSGNAKQKTFTLEDLGRPKRPVAFVGAGGAVTAHDDGTVFNYTADASHDVRLRSYRSFGPFARFAPFAPFASGARSLGRAGGPTFHPRGQQRPERAFLGASGPSGCRIALEIRIVCAC